MSTTGQKKEDMEDMSMNRHWQPATAKKPWNPWGDSLPPPRRGGGGGEENLHLPKHHNCVGEPPFGRAFTQLPLSIHII
jgi:hypothetical protein